MPANSIIAVHLNIGHKASHRTSLDPQGFTHDWSAYVTGADGIEIQHFVEKVVFKLHETFEKPVQVVTEPPYLICESGYASFGLKLEIHFNNHQCRTGENIIHYEYDLYLPGDGQPSVKYFRQERLLFKNTPADFRARLKLGGAKETDPEAIEENAREERRLALATASAGKSLARQSSLTERHKSSDDEKKEKKKKHKDKSSKHKKASKSDREKSNKSSSSSDKPASLFGLPRTSHDERSEKTVYQPPTKALSNSDSSSSSSSESASPLRSPDVPASSSSQGVLANTGTLSASESSSESDDNMNSTNNNSVNKRPPPVATATSNNSSTSKKSKPAIADKPTKKSERNSANPVPKATNGIPVELLLDLHEKIRATDDSILLQRFVDVVEESNQYKVTETSFDFDLYRLDANTIRQLENIFK